MERKNVLKKLMGMAAAVCLMVLMMGMTTFAANKVENIAFGQSVANTDEDFSIVHYYKFTVKNPGAINISAVGVNGSYSTGLNISLCNAQGKVLSTNYVNAASAYEDLQSVTFGVNKGTYQIKIQTPYRYVVAASYKKWPDTNGKTRTKAVALKKKVVKKGVVGIGESAKKADWYKITLTKSAKIKLEFAAQSNTYLYAMVVPSKGAKISGTLNLYAYNKAITTTLQTTTGKKLPAGTYYIKVWRGSSGKSTTSGIYTLKWKA